MARGHYQEYAERVKRHALPLPTPSQRGEGNGGHPFQHAALFVARYAKETATCLGWMADSDISCNTDAQVLPIIS